MREVSGNRRIKAVPSVVVREVFADLDSGNLAVCKPWKVVGETDSLVKLRQKRKSIWRGHTLAGSLDSGGDAGDCRQLFPNTRIESPPRSGNVSRQTTNISLLRLPLRRFAAKTVAGTSLNFSTLAPAARLPGSLSMSTDQPTNDQPVISEVEVRENQEVDDLQGDEQLHPELVQELDEASQPFVGRWNRLVSSTNWEKGRIIQQWRDELKDTGAPATEYSDEAWAQRVGGVTGQHVGRLRRVYQRFGNAYESYDGLFWSHFHAAIEWDDAEMWLEGAVQNRWSISELRRQRWDTLGRTDAEPTDAEIDRGELDEDFEQSSSQRPDSDGAGEGPLHEGPDFGEESLEQVDSIATSSSVIDEVDEERVERVQPFENLVELPEDLNDAFEAFKLAVLRHKGNNWSEIQCGDVLAALDSLKQLALAPGWLIPAYLPKTRTKHANPNMSSRTNDENT